MLERRDREVEDSFAIPVMVNTFVCWAVMQAALAIGIITNVVPGRFWEYTTLILFISFGASAGFRLVKSRQFENTVLQLVLSSLACILGGFAGAGMFFLIVYLG